MGRMGRVGINSRIKKGDDTTLLGGGIAPLNSIKNVLSTNHERYTRHLGPDCPTIQKISYTQKINDVALFIAVYSIY